MIAVYFCVSLISDVISTLPIDTYRKVKGGRDAIPNPLWLDQPNTEMTSVDFWHRVLASMLLDGNAYIYVRRTDSGSVLDLTPVHPGLVTPYRWNGKLTYVVGADANGSPLPPGAAILTPRELLHIPAFVRPGDLKGLSPIEVAREAIGLGVTMEEYGARFFAQGATVSGVIQSPNALEPTQAEIMARSFAARHSGAHKSHLPAVLTAGSTWQPITVPNDQAQFLDSRRFTKTEIGNLYRIPGYLLDPQVSSTWGTGIEEQNRMLVDLTFNPWLVRIETAISQRLLARPQFAKFNLDALLRGRTLDRYQSHQIGISAGFLTVNEARAREDLPPIDGGDEMKAPAAPVPPPAAPAADQPAADQPAADDSTGENQNGN